MEFVSVGLGATSITSQDYSSEIATKQVHAQVSNEKHVLETLLFPAFLCFIANRFVALGLATNICELFAQHIGGEQTAASRLVQAAMGDEIMTEDSFVGESQVNGLDEGAVKKSKGVTRSFMWAVEHLHGVVLDSASPVVPWLVRHAGSEEAETEVGSGGRKELGEIFSEDLKAEAGTIRDETVGGAFKDRPRIFPLEGR